MLPGGGPRETGPDSCARPGPPPPCPAPAPRPPPRRPLDHAWPPWTPLRCAAEGAGRRAAPGCVRHCPLFRAAGLSRGWR